MAKRTAAQAPVRAASEEDGPLAYPKVKYRKVKPSAKCPNGYEARRVYDEQEEAALPKGYEDSPDGMSPEVPFGHRD